MDSVARQIGVRLKGLRTARALTMRALAERIGTTQQAISSLERGTRRPSLRVIERLAKALSVRPIELFAETSPPTPVGESPRGKWNPDIPIEKQIGRRILELHWESRMTQLALAEKSGINNSGLSAIESGKGCAKLATLEKIAKALNAKLEDLFDIDSHRERNSFFNSLIGD